jgi:peptide/nickel transport system permease protein
MLNMVGRRVVAVVPILFGVSIATFILMRLVPGDFTLALLGPFATEQRVAALRAAYGLDQPVPVQYWKWLSAILSGDFGISIGYQVSVASILWTRVLNSTVLTTAAAVIAIVGGGVGGLLAAVRPHSLYDRLTTLTALILASAPTFWFGILLLYVFALKLRWFPAIGMYSFGHEGELPSLLWHLPLPALATSLVSLSVIFRITRASLLDTLAQDYIRAARARGLPEARIVGRHAVRSVIPTVINICGLQIGFIFGSALFVEVIFEWPGIGLLMYNAILARDVPVIEAVLLVIAVVFVLANLITDVVIAALTPQTRAV